MFYQVIVAQIVITGDVFVHGYGSRLNTGGLFSAKAFIAST